VAVIDSAYNYYLTTYGNTSTRYDSHKKSELRNAYNNILKINKESPLYKVKSDENVQRQVIDIKENARNVKNVIASMADGGDDMESFFSKKVPYSSDSDLVSVDYVGENNGNAPTSFNIEVRQLATPQINTGNYLRNFDMDFKPGNYTFDLDTANTSYEFQYSINEGENNSDVLNKLKRLVNTSGIGLSANIISEDGESSALEITSKQTGLAENETFIFNIKPGTNAGSMEALTTLGIAGVSQRAGNSSFLLNGIERSSYSNTFTIGGSFEVTLHGISAEDDPTEVGLKTSVDAVADNVSSLVNSYNSFITAADNYKDFGGQQLAREIKSVADTFRTELESIGLVESEDGTLSIDKALLSQALDSENRVESFSVLSAFKNGLANKADAASTNPFKYVNKLVVEYKNPGRTFNTPYASSVYSGMMLDRFA